MADLLAYIRGTGKEALFIISPYDMSPEEKMQYNHMLPVIQEAGYQVLDLNDHIEEMELDFATDFYDYGSHVNALGEGKCSAFLGSYLKENFDLPDRRGQKEYESWDAAYTLYQEKQLEAESSCLADIANENWMPEEIQD